MTRSLREHPSSQAFLHSFQEEHLSELSFLIAQRRRYLHDPGVAWPDIDVLDLRVLRHAQAMAVGGDVALTCARAAFASEATDEWTAAAHALASMETGLSELLVAMSGADSARLPCFTEALRQVHRPRLFEQLTPLLSSPRPELRAAIASLLGHRHEGGGEALLPLLDDSVSEVRTAAALALSAMGHRPALPWMEQRLAREHMQGWEEWLLAALRLGSSQALHLCRQVARSTDAVSTRVPWLLAVAGSAQDFEALRRLSERPASRLAALEALGILGLPAAAPLLLEFLEEGDDETKGVAAKALSLMTGAGLTETVRVLDTDANDDPESWRDVTRPSTQAREWRAWWMAHRHRLDGDARLRRGQAHGLASCLEELADPHTPFGDRARAALEMDVLSGAPIGLQADWPIRRQLRAIAHWRQR